MDFELSDRDYTLVNSPKKVQWLFTTLARQKICAVDIETSHMSSKPMAGQRDVVIGGISFAWAKGTAAYLPLFTGTGRETHWKRDDVFDAICRKLKDFLEGDCEKVMQNGKFDAAWIWKVLGIKVANFEFDTMLAHHLLDEEGRFSCSHGLKPMAEFYLDPKARQYEKRLHTALDYHDPLYKRYTSVPIELLYAYACSDADYTLQLKALFEPQLAEQNLTSLFYDVVMPLQHTCMLCELGGMDIDMTKVLELEAEYAAKKTELLQKMAELGFGSVDFNSPAQVSVLLYDKLKLPKQFSRKGSLTTDITALEALKDTHPIVEILKEYRSVEKLSTSYVESVKTKTDPATNRLHPSFLVHGTVTGRLSSEEPNCFHPDTEVLTRDGWVRIWTILPTTEIAQWDDGEISFVRPTKFYKEIASELIDIRNRHVSLLVTADHRCLLRHARNGKLEVFAAKDYPERWHQLHAGVYNAGIVRFRNLRHRSDGFGPWIFDLSQTALKELCEAKFIGRICVCDSWKEAVWLQTVLALTGFRGTLRNMSKGRWEVSASWHDYSLTTNIRKRVVPHDSYVYCVSVPSSYVLVKLDDKITVTGQCQNLPRAEHGGTKIKSMFVAGEGNKIVLSDYRQAEVCLAAHLSKDRVWIEALNSGADIHSATAKKCFKLDCPVGDVKKLYNVHRSRAKTVTFGVLYGMSEHGLGPKLNMEKEDAREFIKQYFDALPDLKAWIEFVHQDAKEKGYVTTVFNRRRRLPDIQLAVPKWWPKPFSAPDCFGKKAPPIVKSFYGKESFDGLLPIFGDASKLYDLVRTLDAKQYAKCIGCSFIGACLYDDERRRRANLVSECERQSVNAMVQGSVADIAAVAYARVLEVAVGQGIPIALLPGEKGIRPWSTIHDELGYVVANEYVEPAMRIIEDVMTTVCDLLVPLKVDMVVLDRWSDKH